MIFLTDQVKDEEQDGEDDEEDVVHLRPELLLLGVLDLQLLVGQLLAEPLPLQATLFLFPQEPEKKRNNRVSKLERKKAIGRLRTNLTLSFEL